MSFWVHAVNEYKDLFITPSAHITDRLNHFLAVKMTVAQQLMLSNSFH